MDDLTFARALHVLGVVVWVGGLYFVTFIVLPVARTLSSEGGDGIALFEKAERRFTGNGTYAATWQRPVTAVCAWCACPPACWARTIQGSASRPGSTPMA